MKIVNDTLLIQHVYSNSEHGRLIAMSAERTILYCLKHHIDYHLVVGEVDGDNRDGGHWANICMMREAMNLGYKNIIYLDADTLIADLNTDLREAIVEDKIGAVWHTLIRPEGDHSHFNAGAFYVSNTERTREFVDKWISMYPGLPDGQWPIVCEQGVYNVLGREMGVINSLDPKWNAEAGVSPSDHPVVMGFHGFPDLHKWMRKALAGLEKR
jgi:hypothetical protein